MENNPNSRFKIIYNDFLNTENKLLKNDEIENLILHASNSSNSPEVTVFFKNILASEYKLGYQKFCGIKINNLAFYNSSLFQLYPNLLDFLNFEHTTKFLDALLNINKIYVNQYFSNEISKFEKSKLIKDTTWYVNLNITFDDILKVLDEIVEFIYNQKLLKVLILSSIKNKTIL